MSKRFREGLKNDPSLPDYLYESTHALQKGEPLSAAIDVSDTINVRAVVEALLADVRWRLLQVVRNTMYDPANRRLLFPKLLSE